MIYGDGCVYIPVEKCATHSMRDVLIRGYGWKVLFGLSITHCLGPGFPAEELARRFPATRVHLSILESMKSADGDVYTFAVCRNPYDRMVSTWYDVTHGSAPYNADIISQIGNLSFASFVDWAVSAASSRTLYLPQSATLGQCRVDRLLRFEHLNDDFTRLPFAEPGKLPRHLNKTSDERHHWSAYYDEGTAAAVREWAAVDFDRFGYPTEIGVEVAA